MEKKEGTELPKRGSTRNLKDMFERISTEAKEAEARKQATTINRRSYSTLPRSFRQTDVQGALDGVRVSIAQSRVFAEPQTTTTASPPTSPVARPKRTLTAKSAVSTNNIKKFSSDSSSNNYNNNSPAAVNEIPFDWVISTQKSHQIFDTIRYIKENQQRYHKCVSGPDKVDQIKLQTLLQTNQMFIELLEKQATELVAIIQRLQEAQMASEKKQSQQQQQQQQQPSGTPPTSHSEPLTSSSSLTSPHQSTPLEQVLNDLNNHSESSSKEPLYITNHDDQDDLSKALQALQ
eukprot:TRINITY_DN4067_c0_g3_i1.p1 TRINITY_DN4067_c0_g3~~TRINITY_DN4067_c0_g3_i1.p1  ORF type:complete len:291 (+),score=97.15 TRINITY_DN4067_c0_g3_i1:297-1169(+)